MLGVGAANLGSGLSGDHRHPVCLFYTCGRNTHSSKPKASGPTVVFYLPISSLKLWFYKFSYVKDAHNTFLDPKKQKLEK